MANLSQSHAWPYSRQESKEKKKKRKSPNHLVTSSFRRLCTLFCLMCTTLMHVPYHSTHVQYSIRFNVQSSQQEIGRQILKVPKFYSGTAIQIGLNWPSVSTQILIRKLKFLSKLLSSHKDTVSTRMFNTVAMKDVYITVKKCG